MPHVIRTKDDIPTMSTGGLVVQSINPLYRTYLWVQDGVVIRRIVHKENMHYGPTGAFIPEYVLMKISDVKDGEDHGLRERFYNGRMIAAEYLYEGRCSGKQHITHHNQDPLTRFNVSYNIGSNSSEIWSIIVPEDFPIETVDNISEADLFTLVLMGMPELCENYVRDNFLKNDPGE